MALKPGNGLDKWEIAVAKKLVGEFRRRSRLLARDDFDDLVQDCLLHWMVVRTKLASDSGTPPVTYMAQAQADGHGPGCERPGERAAQHPAAAACGRPIHRAPSLINTSDPQL